MSDLSSEIDAAVDAATTAPDTGSSVPDGGTSTSAPAAPAQAAVSPTTPQSGISAAPATTDAPIQAAGTEDVEPTGPIPLDRHKQILENARTKAEQRVRQEFQQTYGFDRERFQSLRPHIQQLVSDPVSFAQELVKELTQAGRWQAPQAPVQASPQPSDLNALFSSDPARYLRRAEDGSIVPTAEGLMAMDQWQRAQIAKDIEARFAPLEQMRQQAEQREIQAHGWQMATQQLAEARSKWDGFGELESDIKALMLSDGRTTLESAYHRVYREKYAPSLRQRERDKLLSEMKQRPTTTQDVAPGAVRTSQRTGKGKAPDRWDTALDEVVSRLSAAQ